MFVQLGWTGRQRNLLGLWKRNHGAALMMWTLLLTGTLQQPCQGRDCPWRQAYDAMPQHQRRMPDFVPGSTARTSGSC